MQLQTTFEIPLFSEPLDHSQEIVTLGSCFSNVMGQKLSERKFNVLNNPFGTLFNPISLLQLIDTTLTNAPFPEELFLKHDGRHLHFSCHSSMAASSKESLLQLLSTTTKKTKEALSSASLLIITLGTAYIHEHNPSGKIVANCHKQPAKEFSKRMLSIDEITQAFATTYQHLNKVNANLNILLTVSPVRHTKDGIPENQLSKSTLRVACGQIAESYDNINYFPSYEIMMDELRDYRFYKDDLIHPSAQAEDYIWERFAKSHLSENAQKQAKHIMAIKTALAHKPFNAESESHQKFLKNLLSKMEQMSGKFDFTKEIKLVTDQLLTH
ncbi:GSCFA family protein [Echinicola strongylocentroti]|uniref:GSCFA family protein n=1 Tax=Echinicola strongylocentroti TaxID=1795355 RepID=A0A2Z4ILH8_9BACT|nr:GSCFA domain-containing protein [Echinicola strongylocentroti]AWW31785.1 GSCFA family protein [Echinicola strongylocentroti]